MFRVKRKRRLGTKNRDSIANVQSDLQDEIEKRLTTGTVLIRDLTATKSHDEHELLTKKTKYHENDQLQKGRTHRKNDAT